MVFENLEHKKIISELGFDPDMDYLEDSNETGDLFIAVTGRFQKQGFVYDGDEPVTTRDGMLCEEIADILSEIE